MSQIVPLQCLRPGECGCVAAVSGDGALVARLHELGMDAGAQVRMVRGGKSCIFAVGSQRISLRLRPDCQVLVDVGAAAAAEASFTTPGLGPATAVA